MIFETLAVGIMGAGALYYRLTMDARELKPYRERWSELMQELGVSNKNTKSTCILTNITKIENGFIAHINIPAGLSFEDLEKHKKAIENHYRATVTIENKQFSNKCDVKIIDKKLEDYTFSPVKTNEYQIFIGKTFDNKDYIIDMNKNSHLLFLGATGKGKTIELMMVLTNLIYNSGDKIELHLSQITKSETGMLRDCKCVKFFGTKLEDVTLDLERVAKKINYRCERFDTEGVTDIRDYNKYNKNTKMKRIYYVIEELSFFMPLASDLDDIKGLKNRCWSAILEIVKAGRSAGVHFLSVSQRSTTTNLPSDVKSQMTRISFAQISKIDSTNAIECENAVFLKDRECLVYGDSRAMEIIKVPTLNNGYISLQEYVKEIRLPRKVLEKRKKQKIKESGDLKNEAAITITKNNEKIEKVFYEDKRISDEELKYYLENLGRKEIKKDDDNIIQINKFNKARTGVIKGGASNVNKER